MSTFHWIGGSSDWGTNTNWNPNGTPGGTDDVLLDEAGGPFVITANNQAASTLEIGEGNELSISGTFTLSNGTNNLNGDLNGGGIEAGSTLLINGGNANLIATGTILNNGTIALAGNNGPGCGNSGFMTIAGSVTLAGTGQVTLQPDTTDLGNNCGSSNYILSNGAAATLENEANTISGAGVIGDANLTFINDAAGVIDANVSGLPPLDETLFINATSFTNHGTLEATGGGILQIGTTGTTWSNDGTINDTGGSTLILGGSFKLENVGTGFAWSAGTGDTYPNVNVDATSTVELAGTLTLDTVHATITPASIGVGDTLDASQGVFKNLVLAGGTILGGTVIASGPGGALQSAGFSNTSTIHDSLVKNAGTWTIGVAGQPATGDIFQTLIFDGVLNNTGTVALAATCCSNNAIIRVGADGLKLTGGGEVTLAGTTGNSGDCFLNQILSNGTATTLENVDNTISGAGLIGDGFLTVKNDVAGVIDANVIGQPLYLEVDQRLDNFGTLEATSGGTLDVCDCAAQTWKNENGATIRADGATVALYGALANYGLMNAVNGGELLVDYLGVPWTNEVGATISATGSTLDLIGFNNLGTITATNSTLILNTFDNTVGTITATNSTVYLEGNDTLSNFGNFHRTGGAIYLYGGTLNLDGGILDTTQGSFANLISFQGTIDPGTIIDGVGGTLGFCGNNNTLSNVTVDGGLNINSALSCNGAVVHLTNGTKIMNATGTKPGTVTIGDSAIAVDVDYEGYTHLVNNVTLRNANSGLFFSSPANHVLSTGFDAANDPPTAAGGLQDAHWMVNGNPATIVSNLSAVDGGNFVTPDSATSGWIDVHDGGSDSAGLTTFSTTFNVTDPTSEVLSGLWWLNSYSSGCASATLSINGHQISSTGDNCGSNGALFFVDDRNGWFHAGTNTLTITTNGNTCTDNQAVRLQMLSTVTIDKGVTIDGLGFVTDNFGGEGNEGIANKGTINADVNAGNLTVDPSVFINEGIVEATNGGTLTISATGWESQANAVISASGAGSIVDLVGGSVAGKVNIGAGATVESGGCGSTTFLGATVTDKGVLLATNGSLLTLQNTTVNATISKNAAGDIVGGLIESFNCEVALDNAIINNAAFGGGGTITTSCGSNNTLNGVTILAGTTVQVVAQSTLTLEGTITDKGSIAVGSGANGATLAIAPIGLQTGVTLAGGGSVVMSDSSGNLITDTGVAAVLTNAVTISGAGAIGTGDQLLTLQNKGTIDATGVNALTIHTGNPLANSGTLEATGGGKLIVDDNVSGGKTSIASASTVEFAGTLNNSAVSFQNNGGIDTGVFVLDHAATPDAAHGFHGTIAGFAYDLTHSDTLDLRDIKFGGSETWSFTENSTGKAGVLTVNDGLGDIATLNLQGHFLTANQSATSASSTLFALALDSGTGTLVATSHV